MLFFGKKKEATVADVLSSFTETINQLDQIEVRELEKVEREEETIRLAHERQEIAIQESELAASVAEKIRNLIS